MLKPTLTRNKDGSFPNEFCRLITRYWAEEDEWNGDPVSAAIWRKEYECYARYQKLGLEGCTFHPRIEERLQKEKWI